MPKEQSFAMDRHLEALDRVVKLERDLRHLNGFVKSARHALQLLDDGYFKEAAAQIRASLAHLELLQKSEGK